MHSPFVRWAWQCFIKCYNLRLGSGCNIGKDLSKSKGLSQLVKCKNTRVYLQLYIPKDHMLLVRQMSHSIWGKHKKVLPTTWGADWDNMWWSWSLSHNKVIPISVVYELVVLKTWEIDYNSSKSVEKHNGAKQFGNVVNKFFVLGIIIKVNFLDQYLRLI